MKRDLLQWSAAEEEAKIETRPLLLEPKRSWRLGWEPFASTFLHGMLIAIAFLLSGWAAVERPSIPDRVTPVTFEPIPDFHPPAPPAPAAPKLSARPNAVPPAAPPPMPRVEAPRVEPVPPPSPTGQPHVRNEKTAESSGSRREPPSAPSNDNPPGGSEGRSGGFDVNRALRDFGRAVRATEPGPGEDGGGEGKGAGRGQGDGKGLTAPDLSALPSTGFGFGNLEFEDHDFDWSTYARQIYVAIWRAWHNRLYLTTDAFEKWGFQNQVSLLDHQNRIQFTIEKNGEISGVALETPSGCVPLDDSALDALREVVVPPLPADFPKGQETIHARFLATGEIRSMRPGLQYLRNRGYF